MSNDELKAPPPSGGGFLEELEAALALDLEQQKRNEGHKSELCARAARFAAAKRAGKPTPDEPKIPPVVSGRDVGAAAMGLKTAMYGRARTIHAAATADPEKYGPLLARMTSKDQIYKIYGEYELLRAGKSVRHEVFRNMRHRGDRSKEIERAILTLEGMGYALKQIPTEAIAVERRDELSRALERASATIIRFARKLK